MSDLTAWEYIAVFVGTLALTTVLSPIALRVAVRTGILDRPGEIKAQESPVPYLGGAAITVAFAAVMLAAALLRPPPSGLDELGIILGLAVLLAIVGLVDDLRGLSAFLRLGIEILAGVAISASPAGGDLLSNSVLDLIVTVAWVVVVTNSLNLLDNMDGLSAGVASIAALSFFFIAVSNGQFLVAVLSLALAGCALGFLRSNFHPAKIYMGDAGALFIGFMLAVIGLKLRFELPKDVSFLVPILVLGVPLFDTTLVVVNRLLHRRNPLIGGLDHTSHRIVFVGIPVPAAVTLIYLGAGSLGWLGIIMGRLDRSTGMFLAGWVLVVAALVGVLLSRVPVYESSRRRHLMLREVERHETEPRAGFGIEQTDDLTA